MCEASEVKSGLRLKGTRGHIVEGGLHEPELEAWPELFDQAPNSSGLPSNWEAIQHAVEA